MAIINQATKELQVKIVYYGPAKSGKTTNLEQVHANVQVPEAKAKGKLRSLEMDAEKNFGLVQIGKTVEVGNGLACEPEFSTDAKEGYFDVRARSQHDSGVRLMQ